jgi:hypothetical protein
MTKKKAHRPKYRAMAKRVGLTLGILGAIGIGALGLMAKWFGWGAAVVHMIGSLYTGYNATCLGIIKGMLWAFVDFFIGGWLFVWIYHKLEKCKLTKNFIK